MLLVGSTFVGQEVHRPSTPPDNSEPVCSPLRVMDLSMLAVFPHRNCIYGVLIIREPKRPPEAFIVKY